MGSFNIIQNTISYWSSIVTDPIWYRFRDGEIPICMNNWWKCETKPKKSNSFMTSASRKHIRFILQPHVLAEDTISRIIML